jgi:hypothetical protein
LDGSELGSRRLRFVDPAITPALPLTGSTAFGVTRSRRCRSSRRRRYQNPVFQVATSLGDAHHFFPVATRLPCGRSAAMVRPDASANSNPRRTIMNGVDGTTGAQSALSAQQKDNSVENLQKQVENKKFTDALQTAKQLIQSS